MNNNIRLLQVVPSLNSGGVEQGTVDIAENLIKSGYYSSVVSNGGRLVSLLEKFGSKHFKFPVHSKNPFIIYNNIFNLKKIILNEKINILHTRSRAPAWSSYYAGKNKVKLVSTFHNIYGHQNSLKKFYNSGLAKADSIIAISQFVKENIIKLYNVSEDKITVIYRGINEKNYNSNNINEKIMLNFISENNIINNNKIILYPGRLTKWKGQIEFLKVLKKLKTKNFCCYFVGDNKNRSYAIKLSKEIENFNLNKKCRIMGHISDMKYIYKLSDLVVNGSQEPEGFGRVVSEAMCMEKPVIAYAYGGVAEQLATQDEMFKIPINDFEKMACSIDKVLNMSKDKINLIGQKSSTFVKQSFTKDIMTSKTLNLYKRLLNGK